VQSDTNKRFARRRQQAIIVAASVFAEKGYLGASTQDIAARLGIQQASLYYYFKSKEEALEEVCLMGTSGALEQLEEIAARDESVAMRLRAVVLRHLYGLRTDCHALIVVNEQRHHLAPERRERVRAHSRRYRELLQQLMADGVARGELKAGLDCSLATRALIGLCDSVASWYARSPHIDLNKVAAHYADLFIDGAGTAHATPVPSATCA
jgi:AcrR family transcriptional regulator